MLLMWFKKRTSSNKVNVRFLFYLTVIFTFLALPFFVYIQM